MIPCCPDRPPMTAPATTARRPRGVALGFGDIFAGDDGVGLYMVEALTQDVQDEDVVIRYMAGDCRALPFALHGADAAVLILGHAARGRSGAFATMDLPAFRTLAALDDRPGSRARDVAKALAWLEVVGGVPAQLLFVVFDLGPGMGLAFSEPLRQGARAAMAPIRNFFAAAGVAGPAEPTVSRLYRVPWLGVAF